MVSGFAPAATTALSGLNPFVENDVVPPFPPKYKVPLPPVPATSWNFVLESQRSLPVLPAPPAALTTGEDSAFPLVPAVAAPEVTS